ncbi:MAG: Rho termination factor N-terminal domain-containing protein [Methanobacterium paludis]|nr:Rho termination factor N-terminal domain-containing protein [Methanobacterium paludis]
MLKTITMKELKEICKVNGLKGYSKYKQNELIKFAAENLKISLPKLKTTVEELSEQRLVSKIKDSEDYVLRKVVNIESYDKDLITATVGSHKLKLYNFGTEDFSYLCDGKCPEYIYRVKQGKSPFCKHYPAVIAELIYEEKLDPTVTQPNFISGKRLEAVQEIVEKRKKEDGIVKSSGRNIEDSLKNIREDILEISCKNDALAREKYHEKAEKVFKTLVDECFQLLEYETVFNRRNEGWDLLLIGTNAPKPYMVVVNCKPADSGTYRTYRNPNFVLTLKNQCIDMCKEQLIGVYKDYVKYMVVVAPDFNEEITQLIPEFNEMTGGVKLSFLPVSTLLYLVENYRENPILTHYNSECLFKKDIITTEDVDELFKKSEEHVEELTLKAKKILRDRMTEICKHNTDSCYIKIDEIFLQTTIEDIMSTLNPYILKQGMSEFTGVKNININHDYYVIWGRVLKGLTDEFTNLLKERSSLQIQRSTLKEDVIKYLGI